MATHPITLDLGPVMGPQGPGPTDEQLTPIVEAAVEAAVAKALAITSIEGEDEVLKKITLKNNVEAGDCTIYRFNNFCLLQLFLHRTDSSQDWGESNPQNAVEHIVATIDDSDLRPKHVLRGAIGHTSQGGTGTPSAYFVLYKDGKVLISGTDADFVIVETIYPVA